MMRTNLTRWLLALLVAVVVTPAMPMQQIEGAVEAEQIYFSPGPPARVRAVGCTECPRSFLAAQDVELFFDGQRVAPDDLPSTKERPGTVIYDLATGRAVRVLW